MVDLYVKAEVIASGLVGAPPCIRCKACGHETLLSHALDLNKSLARIEIDCRCGVKMWVPLPEKPGIQVIEQAHEEVAHEAHES